MPASTTRRAKRGKNKKTNKRSYYKTINAASTLYRYSMVPYFIFNGEIHIITMQMFNNLTDPSETSFSFGLPGIGILPQHVYKPKASSDYIGEISHKFVKLPGTITSTCNIAVTLHPTNRTQNLYSFIEVPPSVSEQFINMNIHVKNTYKNLTTFYQYLPLSLPMLDLLFTNGGGVLKADLNTLVHAMKIVQNIDNRHYGLDENLVSVTFNYSGISFKNHITGNPNDIKKFTNLVATKIPGFGELRITVEEVTNNALFKALNNLPNLTKAGISKAKDSSKLNVKLDQTRQNEVSNIANDAYDNYTRNHTGLNPFDILFNNLPNNSAYSAQPSPTSLPMLPTRETTEDAGRRSVLNPHALAFVPQDRRVVSAAQAWPAMPAAHAWPAMPAAHAWPAMPAVSAMPAWSQFMPGSYVPYNLYGSYEQQDGPTFGKDGALYATAALASAADKQRAIALAAEAARVR